MPQLGETVTEGKVAAWFKSVGDAVAAGENLLEIETDKVTMEVQAIASGIVSEIRVAAGETVSVGTVLAVLGTGDGAKPPKANGEAAAAPPARKLEPFGEVHTPTQSYGKAEGPLGLKVTPLARRLVKEGGLDLAAIAEEVRARGGRRIAAADLKAAPMIAAKPALEQRGGDGVVPLNRIRAQTASRLAESWRTVPHVFQAVEIDFSAVTRARDTAKERYRERHDLSLTYLPFLARDGLGEAARIHLVGVMHHRHDQPLMREIDGDAEIDVAMEQQLVSVE